MRRVPRRIWVYLLLILIGIAPMLSVIIAGAIATANDCGLHEGFPQPCIVWGRDIGDVLYAMGVMGWLMLVTVMFAAAGVLGLLAEAAGAILRRLLR